MLTDFVDDFGSVSELWNIVCTCWDGFVTLLIVIYELKVNQNYFILLANIAAVVRTEFVKLLAGL
jgi:hypothetical protein